MYDISLQGSKSCYARISGTSAAVPFVAGTAALIASMPNAPKGKDAGVAIKRLILRHADKKVAMRHFVVRSCACDQCLQA